LHVRNAQGARGTEEREYSSVGGIKNGKLEENEYDERKLRDKVVDEEGMEVGRVRESMKIWQEKGERCRVYEPN
jgi:hypothetical protein